MFYLLGHARAKARSASSRWMSRASTFSLSRMIQYVDGRNKPGHDERVGSAITLPDQDQSDGAEHRAISRPLQLVDHDARLRPANRAGALTDPQQPDGERQKADD